MAAASTDKFTKVGSPGTATTLAAPGHLIAGTSITVGATTNWPTDTGVVFAMDTVTLVNGVEVRDTGTYTEWEGVVSSATGISTMVLKKGTDQNYPAGATTRVYIPVAASQNDQMVDGLIVGHNQDGTHITSLPLTTPKITTSINDVNGNEVIKTPATTNAVNEVTVTNAATGTDPRLSATGGDTNIGLNLRGKGTGKVNLGAGALAVFPYDYVASGCVWTGDSYGVTRAASMTAGVVVINGNPVTVAAVTARSFTASKDTYIDVRDNGDGTGLLVYNEVANNAASQALTAGDLRIGIIVTAAGSIAAVGSVNQGEENKLLPIASSSPYATTDSLGNLICPRDPQRKILAYREITADQSTASTTPVAVPGLGACPFIMPAGRAVKITLFCANLTNSTSGSYANAQVHNGSISGNTNQIMGVTHQASTAADANSTTLVRRKTFAAGSQNLVVSYKAIVSGNASFGAGAEGGAERGPGGIMVELV
jgi:hypothetical protein